MKLGGLHRVARQPKLEAKASDESRNRIGGRWGVVVWRRVRSGRWSAERYSDREYDSYSLEEEISDVSLSTFYVFDRENAGARRPGLQLAKRTGSPRQGSGGRAEDCAGGGPTCCASCATGGARCG